MLHQGNSARPCRIGILMVQNQPYHVKATSLLLDEIHISKPGMYVPRIHRLTDFDEDSVKTKVAYLIHSGSLDVLFTIGEMCTTYAKEIADQMGGFPIIFVGVRDPLGSGLVDSLENPGSEITGVIRTDAPVERWAESISLFLPQVRTICMPYLATAKSNSLIKLALAMQHRLQERGMEVLAVPITRDPIALLKLLDEYSFKVQGFLLLDGCYANIVQNNVALLCWQKLLVFFGSNVASIDAGASCSLSGDINQLVTLAHKKVQDFWERNVPLSAMPITALEDNREFYVNIDMLKRIGFPDEALEKLLTNQNIRLCREWTAPPQLFF